MKTLSGEHCSVSLVDHHIYICDLINIEGPLLSLHRDSRSSWLYLWADTNGSDTNRWLLFAVDRKSLVNYLKGKLALRSLVEKSDKLFALDITMTGAEKATAGVQSARRQLKRVEVQDITEYLPSKNSLFDESLTADISLAHEVSPSEFVVPIDGTWFLPDLDRFSRAYTRLYAFFYCTKPRFVTNLGEKLDRYLHAPWQGGYSRINMFDALHKLIPSVHDTKVAKFNYASPGEVTIEALGSVGASIRDVVHAFIANYDEVKRAKGAIDATLTSAKLKKSDLSRLSDAQLAIGSENFAALKSNTALIAKLLNLEVELASITSHSPNSVVTAKAAMAVLTQIGRIAEYQRAGMLKL